MINGHMHYTRLKPKWALAWRAVLEIIYNHVSYQLFSLSCQDHINCFILFPTKRMKRAPSVVIFSMRSVLWGSHIQLRHTFEQFTSVPNPYSRYNNFPITDIIPRTVRGWLGSEGGSSLCGWFCFGMVEDYKTTGYKTRLYCFCHSPQLLKLILY
jgi:hypothetical protein